MNEVKEAERRSCKKCGGSALAVTIENNDGLCQFCAKGNVRSLLSKEEESICMRVSLALAVLVSAGLVFLFRFQEFSWVSSFILAVFFSYLGFQGIQLIPYYFFRRRAKKAREQANDD